MLAVQQRQPQLDLERSALFDEVQRTVDATQTELMSLKRKLRQQKDKHHDENPPCWLRWRRHALLRPMASSLLTHCSAGRVAS